MSVQPTERIIVTGAAGGIGVATIQLLAREGRELVCVDLDQDSLEAILDLDLPIKPQLLVSDLSSPAECERVIEQAGGGISGLVHLAGIFERDDEINADATHWDRIIGANLRNAYDLVGAMMPELLHARTPARFVFVSSLAFRRGSPENMAYSISKGGIVGLVRSLSRKLGARARVNGLAPGIIETPMVTDLVAEHGERLLGSIPLERFGKPEDVASVIDFLMSPAADYITGQILNVDGGMVFS
ncbi:MAG: SDR family NAD(P)-dependent oxidoreductase [Pseudomonadota bacterium]